MEQRVLERNKRSSWHVMPSGPITHEDLRNALAAQSFLTGAVKSGNLVIKGKWTWKLRFFVLKDTILYFFKSSEATSGSPEGFIALTAECTVEQAPDARKFGFALTTGVGNPDYFAAETAEDMKSWINAINSAIESINKEGWESFANKSWEIPWEDIQVAKNARNEPQRLGAGAAACVMKGTWNKTEVAIKVLFQGSDLKELRKEVALLSALRHPNVVEFLGACTKPPNLCILTAFMRYGSLYDVLHNRNHKYYSPDKFTLPLILKIAKDTTRGMIYLHEYKVNGVKTPIIHRDLKSGNILISSLSLDADTNAKLTDFGVSRQESNLHTQRQGTPAYMAPEVMISQSYTVKVDVYSFAIILWEMFAKALPFSWFARAYQIEDAVLKGERPPIPEDTPATIVKLMSDSWHQQPDQRPTFAELLERLLELEEMMEEGMFDDVMGDVLGDSKTFKSESPKPEFLLTNIKPKTVHTEYAQRGTLDSDSVNQLVSNVEVLTTNIVRKASAGEPPLLPAKEFKFKGEWKGESAGGCLNHSSWRFNPQYFVVVKTNTHVKIILTQEPNKKNQNFFIGFYVAKTDGSGKRELDIYRDENRKKTPFEDLTAVSTEVVLVPLPNGTPYVIIPCTFRPGEETKYTLAVTGDHEFTMYPVTGRYEWKHSVIHGKWQGNSAGGCRNHSTFIHNPSILMKTEERTTAKILLLQSQEKFDFISFYVFKSSPGKEETLEAKAEFANEKEALSSVDIEPGSVYRIRPCTFKPGMEGKFVLHVFSEHLIHLGEEKSDRLIVKGKWNPSGGCRNYYSWRDNPQYRLILGKPTELEITLVQSETSNAMGLYLTAPPKSDGRLEIVQSDDTIIKKTSFVSGTKVSMQFKTNTGGVFNIIPAIFEPKKKGSFELIVRGDHKEMQLSKLKKVKRIEIQGEWKGSSAAGCLNYPSWVNNPQYRIVPNVTSWVSIVVIQSPECHEKKPTELDAIGCYVVEADGDGILKDPPNVIAKSGFEDSQDVGCEVLLKEGVPYIVMPCTFEPGIERKFSLLLCVDKSTLTVEKL